MEIKQPNDSKPLKKITSLFDDFAQKINTCKKKNHKFVSILYLSSYTLTSAKMILDKKKNLKSFPELLGEIISLSPSNVICLLRTVASSVFSGKMRTFQKKTINNFRKEGCYVFLIDPNSGLNHAKYILLYHICFDESIMYHGRYFGSTNFTGSGLSFTKIYPGNYEVFQHMNLAPRKNIRWDNHLEEILSLVKSNVDLYTSPDELKKYYQDKLNRLESIYDSLKKIISQTTIFDFLTAYVKSTCAIYEALTLIESLPGQRFFKDILAKDYRETYKLDSILEIDILASYITQIFGEGLEKYMNENRENELKKVFEILGLTNKELKDSLRESILTRLKILKDLKNVIEKYHHLVSNTINTFEELEKYMTPHEKEYYIYIKKYGGRHLEYLRHLKLHQWQ